MDQKTISEIQTRMFELKNRARKANFIDIMPKIPTFKKEHPYVHESQLRGFLNRLLHWEACLKKLEFVNPKPSKEVKDEAPQATQLLEITASVKLILNGETAMA